MLVDPARAIPEALEKVRKDYFFDFKYALLFSEISEMWNEGKPVELLTVCQRLDDKNLTNKVGGREEVTRIWGFVPSAVNLPYYIAILRDKWLARKTHEEASKLAKDALDRSEEIEVVLAEGQSAILALNQSENQVKSIIEHGTEAFEHIEKLYANKGEIIGLTTGLTDLDRKLRGMKPGNLVIVAAPTGEGKTSLGMNIAEHQAVDRRNGVLIFSLEMTGDELVQRLIQSRSGINIEKDAERGGRGIQKISAAATQIMGAPIFIRDDSDLTSSQVRAIARKMSHEHDIKLVIVDYIGLLCGASDDENRAEQLSEMAKSLLAMSKELRVVVIAMSQLNDDGKLFASRAIGHHANVVMGIENDKQVAEGKIIRVSKNRNGERGVVPVTFLRDITKFVNRSHLVIDKNITER
jgi:replicative DNA helicase